MQQIVDNLKREGLTLASFGKRGAAFLVDKIIVSLIFTFIIMDASIGAMDLEEAVLYMNSVIGYYLTLEVIYHTFFVWYYGATPAKMLFNIKVVDMYDLERPRFQSALLRSVIRVIGDFLFYINYIWAHFNPARQTLQDKVVRTVVINVH